MTFLRKKIKKVMLVFPPVVFSCQSPKQVVPPLGIAYLAAYIRDSYEVKLLDAAVEGYENERAVGGDFLVYGLSSEQIKQKIGMLIVLL